MRITQIFIRPSVAALFVSLTTISLLLVTTGALANNYNTCVELVRVDPDAAYDMSLVWEETDLTGGASHCAGLALVGLRLFDAAAERFTRAAVNGQELNNEERAALHSQAGEAWLIVNKGSEAVISFTQALSFVPEDATMLYGRARGYELGQQTALALEDVNLAIAKNPTFAASYLLRGRLYRQQNQLDAAQADLETALVHGVDPIAARLERGLIRFEQGNEAGALEDWQAIVVSDRRPDGSLGPAAQAASGLIAEVTNAAAATQP